MYNDHLSSEEAKERIRQRVKEVEKYSLHEHPGDDGSKRARWVVVFIILMIVVVFWLLF